MLRLLLLLLRLLWQLRLLRLRLWLLLLRLLLPLLPWPLPVRLRHNGRLAHAPVLSEVHQRLAEQILSSPPRWLPRLWVLGSAPGAVDDVMLARFADDGRAGVQ